MKLLERALDIVNKWPRDIGDWWRPNLVKDVVSVVVTVVIVNTVKPLPLSYCINTRGHPTLDMKVELINVFCLGESVYLWD